MPEIVGGFTYAKPEWMELIMGQPDGPEQAAQQIADRGGKLDQEYARAALPELRTIYAKAQERGAAPAAVHVPVTPAEAPPLVTATAFMVLQQHPDAGRTLEAISAVLREPRSYRLQAPDIQTVTLPLGPACRVREVAMEGETDDGRHVLIAYVTYYVLSPTFPDGVVEFTVTWTTIGLGELMESVADQMAGSLSLDPV